MQNHSISLNVFDILSQQVLIPVFVSLSSCALYDILKDKVLAKMKKSETKRLLESFNKLILNTKTALSDECLNELLDQLSPFGLNKDDILEMYNSLLKNLEEKMNDPGASSEVSVTTA